MLKSSSPIFAVRDVKASITFYRDVLGFSGEWLWGDPVDFGGIHCGPVHVMFHRQPEIAQHIAGHEHHYWSDELEALHAKHVASAAPIISPIENKPWGLREYTVRDPDGYHLRFSGPETFDKPAAALSQLPKHVHTEVRYPTEQEYRDLHRAVGWGELKDFSPAIERNLFCVIATDSHSGLAVGMLRVMHDARGFFSIWDVMVRPDYQNQQIGRTILNIATAEIRRRCESGASVFLFTHKSKFYESCGFQAGEVMRIKV